MKHLLPATLLLCCFFGLNAQNNARITGSLQANGNFFIYDADLITVPIPQYDNQIFGAESWLNLNYANWGFDMGLRFDMFNNSNLFNPLGSYNGQGVGRWYVRKSIDKFDLAGGYLYDQIGSGIIYRAYEERALMIDNALFGVSAGYRFNENWKVRVFAGKQKQQFEIYGTNLRGAALEGFIKPDSSKNFTLAPGIGVVGRTYDEQTVNQVVGDIRFDTAYSDGDLQHNTYAASIFNTMTAGPFTWYVEGAYKTKDVFYVPPPPEGGADQWRNTGGHTVYTSLAYARQGLGITLEGKRTENFSLRQNPYAIGIQGPINYLPPMAKQNTYRLTTRFAPATQELGEQALQLDARYALTKKISLGLNVSEIQLLDGEELYREITPEITWKYKRKWQAIAGVQVMKYNTRVYLAKVFNDDYVEAVTPFGEFLYRFTPRRSLRIEAQYLSTKDEFGSWAYALAELGWAPHWLLYVSDMYNVRYTGDPNHPDVSKEITKYDNSHFPTIGVVYTQKANRFGLAFVKQVEGINCAGGICRYEPAFSGVRMQINSSF